MVADFEVIYRVTNEDGDVWELRPNTDNRVELRTPFRMESVFLDPDEAEQVARALYVAAGSTLGVVRRLLALDDDDASDEPDA